MTEPAAIGHNGAPEEIEDQVETIDPIDAALEPFQDEILEAENWLDGKKVENSDQMDAVDALIKVIRKAKSAVGKARDEATKPLHEKWQQEIQRWKPTQDDVERRLKGLVAVVSDFKQREHQRKEAERIAAEKEALRKQQEALEAMQKADNTNYQETVEAEAKVQEAKQAAKQASRARNDKVKGMRTVHHHKITDYKAALNWIARNDRDAMTAFIETYCQQNFRDKKIDGVEAWQTKEAY